MKRPSTFGVRKASRGSAHSRRTRALAAISALFLWCTGAVVAFAGVNAQITAELVGARNIQVKGSGFPVVANVTITYTYGTEKAVQTAKSSAAGTFEDSMTVPEPYVGPVRIVAKARLAVVKSAPEEKSGDSSKKTTPTTFPESGSTPTTVPKDSSDEKDSTSDEGSTSKEGTGSTGGTGTKTPSSGGTVSADATVMVEGQTPTKPPTERVASPNPSPIADAASLTGEKISIGCSDSPEQLNGKTLGPGTVVTIARGCSWDDVRVTINGNGTEAQPVLVTSGGDASGALPSFSAKKGGDGKDGGIITLEGSNVHLQGVAVRDAMSIGIGANATNSVLDNIEGSNVVAGVWIRGEGSKVWNSYFHDLRLMADTPGSNDDYGANGITVEANNVVIEGLTCRNCKASSPDYDQYGGDGSFVEVWNQAENLQVRYGAVIVSARVLEAGGMQGKSARNMLLEYVYAEDISDQPIYLNPGGDYGSIDTSGFTERNNTIP